MSLIDQLDIHWCLYIILVLGNCGRLMSLADKLKFTVLQINMYVHTYLYRVNSSIKHSGYKLLMCVCWRICAYVCTADVFVCICTYLYSRKSFKRTAFTQFLLDANYFLSSLGLLLYVVYVHVLIRGTSDNWT